MYLNKKYVIIIIDSIFVVLVNSIIFKWRQKQISVLRGE